MGSIVIDPPCLNAKDRFPIGKIKGGCLLWISVYGIPYLLHFYPVLATAQPVLQHVLDFWTQGTSTGLLLVGGLTGSAGRRPSTLSVGLAQAEGGALASQTGTTL